MIAYNYIKDNLKQLNIKQVDLALVHRPCGPSRFPPKVMRMLVVLVLLLVLLLVLVLVLTLPIELRRTPPPQTTPSGRACRWP